MTAAKNIIQYLGGLTITQGRLTGKPFPVLPWERRFVTGAFKAGVATAALSVGRGNGKTALVAGIGACAVEPESPLFVPRGETVIVASSFEQARIAFEHIVAFLGERVNLKDHRTWRVLDTVHHARVEYKPTKTRVRCIGSDPKRAHGLAPVLILADEPAQWPENTGEKMVAALRTAAGKQPHCRFVALGTRAASETHWFEKMLQGGADYAQNHAARAKDPRFQRRTWARANPSLKHMPDLEQAIRLEAKEAKRDPSILASFEALRLNLGVSDTVESTLLEAGTWESIMGSTEAAGECVWGVDLGTTAAQSAISAYYPETGRLDVVSAFPNEPTLDERGLRDGVGNLYVECARRGELIQTGGASVDVVELLAVALERFGAPVGVAADRWREGELRDALAAAGIPIAALELRGMGFKDGAEDVRTFRRACLEGKVVPERSLLLTHAMSQARVAMDPAGNAKLAKKNEGGRRQLARDDAAAAGILAVSAGVRNYRATEEAETEEEEVFIAR